jgi:hypothetical protein
MLDLKWSSKDFESYTKFVRYSWYFLVNTQSLISDILYGY